MATYDRQIAYGEESAWNSPVARTKLYEELVDFSPDMGREVEEIYDASASVLPATTKGRKFKFGATIKTKLLDGKQLQYLFGTCVDAGSSPYTHTMTCGALPSLTIEECCESYCTSGNVVLTFSGMKCTEGDISWTGQGDIELSQTFIGGDVTTGTSKTAGLTPTATPILYDAAHLTSGSFKLDGTQISCCMTNGKIAINNNTKSLDCAGNLYKPGQEFEQKRNFSANFEFALKDKTMFDNLLAGASTHTIIVKFDHPVTAGYYIEFTLSNCTITASTLKFSINDLNLVAMDVKPQEISCVVSDGTATY